MSQLSAIRFFVLFGYILLITACGGGGGSGSGDNGSDQTQSSDSGDTNPDSSEPVDAEGEGSSAGESAESDSSADSGGGSMPPGGSGQALQSPKVISLWSQGVPFGEGRIIDDTISFSGTAERHHVIELWLNGVMNGSTVVNGQGEWSLDFTRINLSPGAYSVDLVSISPRGERVESERPFLFRYDPTAPAAPVISAISDDSYIAGDGYTTDGTVIVSGTVEPGLTVTLYLDNVAIGSTVSDVDGNWVVDHSALDLADGSYMLTADAVFVDLQSAISAQFPLTVDRAVPLAPSNLVISSDTGVSATDGITSDVDLVLSGLAEANAQIRVRLDSQVIGTTRADTSGNWSFDYRAFVLSDGNYQVVLMATDLAGNQSPWSTFPIVIDTAAPNPVSSLTMQPDTGIVGDGLTSTGAIQLVGTADPGDQVEVFIDGVAAGRIVVDNNGDWLLDLSASPLPDGAYSITAQVVDTAGNRSSVSTALDIVVNTVQPNVPALTAITTDTGNAGDYITSDTSPTLQGTADVGAIVHVLVDGLEVGTSAAVLGNWSYDLPALVDGTYAVTTFAQNVVGLQSPLSASQALVIDTIAPASPGSFSITDDTGLADGITNDTTLIFSGIAEPNSRVEMFVDGTSAGFQSADGAGNWQFDLTTAPFSDGNYSVRWQATDTADNTSVLSAPFALVIDTAAPVAPQITSFSNDTGVVGDQNTADTTLVFSGTSEPGSTVELIWGGTVRASTSVDGSGAWSVDYTGTTLSSGVYDVTAEAIDAAGNRSAASLNFAVEVDAIAPSAPVVTGISTDTGVVDGITSDNTLVISGTAEAEAEVTVLIGGSNVGTTIASAGVWAFDYTGTLLLDGEYAINVTATDAAGNVSPASLTFNLSIDSGAPAAPVIASISTDTNVVGDGVTSDSTLVVSGTSEPDATVDLHLDGGAIGTAIADAAGAWIFDYSSVPLVDGTYELTASAADVAGNSSSISAGFTVVVDATLPAAPVITAISDDTSTPGDGLTSDNTLAFSGTSEASALITLYQDGSSIGTVTADSVGNWTFDHSATALATGAYSFTAQAQDLAGNNSALSGQFDVVVDSSVPAAPSVLAISIDSGSADGITSDNSLIISGSGEAGATVTLMIDGSTIGNSVVDGSGAWSFDYTPTLLSDADYSLSATQTDGAGNTSVASNIFTVTIDTTSPLLSSSSPVDGATDISFNDNLVLNFDENVYVQSGNIEIRDASDDSLFEIIPVGDARVSGTGTSTITVDPDGTFLGGSDYYVLLDTGAFIDLATNSYAGIATSTGLNFTTASTALTSSVPADEATDVVLNSTITLNFNEAVLVNTGNIVIHKLSDGSVWDSIDVNSAQVTGSGTSTLVITQSDVLEPNVEYYVTIDATALVNGAGIAFTGITDNSTLNFTALNVSIPTVTNVTSTTPDGTYGVGTTINVSVSFSEAVNVTLATPQLELDMEGVDRLVDLASGSGTSTLSFGYTVVLGDGTTDLDYTTTTALLMNGARIRSDQFASADLTLPAPTTAGSLSLNKDIAIVAQELDVSNMSTTDGFQVEGGVSGEHLGWAVSSVGDINGDGFEDFVTGAPDYGGSSGVTYVVYGQAGATRNDLLATTISNGINGFRITGVGAVDKMGGAVGGAGDINDDGYDDLYVVAPLDDDYASDGGILYVVYGGISNGDVAVSSFNSSVGFRVTTAETDARIADSFTDFNGNGQALDAGGDFNGDGIDDLIVGIRYSDRDGADSGKAYVVFGQSGSTRNDVDLDMIDTTGPNGMMIYGAGAGWQLGQAARFVGDYDADGYDDVVVSAIFSDELAFWGGQSFLVFGSPGPLFNAIDVSALSGGSGFKIQSSISNGILGHSVDGGDFNGDGISDIVLSSEGKDSNGKSGNGAVYVLYGNDSGSYANIDVDTILASDGFALFGENDADQVGHSLASAGDFNVDGVDDLLIGAYLNSAGGAASGVGYMILGKDGFSRADVDLATLTNVDGFKVVGDAADDRLGQSTGQADVNGDGYVDLLIGAPLGDNGVTEGGETVVIWGRDFSQSILPGLTGDAGANNIVGTSGNDTIITGGGADVVAAGSGDDVILLSDTAFYNIEGGLGTDTLQFDSTLNNLDLTSIGPELINGIEVIDLADGGNVLTLSQKSMLSLSRETRVLFVKGGSSDSVISSAGDGWCYTGTRNVGGINYNLYLDEGAVLYVQTAIDSSAVNSFNSTQQYTFNTTSGGAGVNGNVSSFPVLIRASSGIVGTLQGDLADVRFTDRDQLTWLPYEVEVGPSGQMNVWVLVPQVDGNSSSDYIVMHYNDVQNGSVPDRQNPTKVWKDYGAVWHFGEGASGTAFDSTAYQNHAAQTSGNVGDNSNRLIGYGRDFVGNETLQAPYDVSFNADNKAFTVESWVREPGFLFFGSNPRMEILSRGTSGKYWNMTSIAVQFSIEYSPRYVISDGSSTSTLAFDGGGGWFSSEQWVHQVMVVHPTNGVRIYTNGSLDATGAYRNMENGQPFKMGSSNADFELDEVRYGRFAADANRIKLSYQNQRSSGFLVSP